jgi:urea transport system substrate-binding protein
MGANRPGLNELAVRSYEGAMLWAEAVKKAGTATANPVIEALRTGLTYNGPSGASPSIRRPTTASRTSIWASCRTRVQHPRKHEAQPPADTQLVCDLVENPDQSTFYFENGLAAAGIK